MSTETDPSSAALSRAIDKADAETLRSVLESICSSSAECKEAASKLMLVPAKKRKTKSGTSKKRKLAADKVDDDDDTGTRSRYEVCETCDETFDVTKNGPRACKTHDGQLLIGWCA